MDMISSEEVVEAATEKLIHLGWKEIDEKRI
jgi:hypothetical protein